MKRVNATPRTRATQPIKIVLAEDSPVPKNIGLVRVVLAGDETEVVDLDRD